MTPPAPAPVPAAGIAAWWNKLSATTKTVLSHAVVVASSVAAVLGTLAAVLPAINVPGQYVAIVTGVAAAISSAITFLRAHHMVTQTRQDTVK